MSLIQQELMREIELLAEDAGLRYGPRPREGGFLAYVDLPGGRRYQERGATPALAVIRSVRARVQEGA